MAINRLNPFVATEDTTHNLMSPELLSYFLIDLGLTVATELDHGEAVFEALQAIQERSDVMMYRVDLQATRAGAMSVCVQGDGWSAASLQTALQALGVTVGPNNFDMSGATVTDTGFNLVA